MGFLDRKAPGPGAPAFHFARLMRFVGLTHQSQYRYVPERRCLVHKAILSEYRQIKAFGLKEAHEARLLVNAETSRLGWVIPS